MSGLPSASQELASISPPSPSPSSPRPTKATATTAATPLHVSASQELASILPVQPLVSSSPPTSPDHPNPENEDVSAILLNDEGNLDLLESSFSTLEKAGEDSTLITTTMATTVVCAEEESFVLPERDSREEQAHTQGRVSRVEGLQSGQGGDGHGDRERAGEATNASDAQASSPATGQTRSEEQEYEFVEAPERGVAPTTTLTRTGPQCNASISGLSHLPSPPLQPPPAVTQQPRSSQSSERHSPSSPALPTFTGGPRAALPNPYEPFRDVGFHIFSHFSRVTQAAKATTSTILSHPLTTPFLPLLPPSIAALSPDYNHHVRSMHQSRGAGSLEHVLNEFGEAARAYVGQMLNNEVWTMEGTEGFEVVMCDHTHVSNAGVVSERGVRFQNLGPEAWVEMVDEKGELVVGMDKLREVVFFGGVDMDVRDHVWKWLLGYWNERGTLSKVLEVSPPLRSFSSESISEVTNDTAQPARLIRKNISTAKVESESKHEYKARRALEYQHLKRFWIRKISPTTASSTSDVDQSPEDQRRLQEGMNRVIKDVMRTDRQIPFFASNLTMDEDALKSPDADASFGNLVKLRDVLMTYTVYDWDMGYVQGMSDLCAPLLLAMRGDEVECFWCFVGLMTKMRGNFKRDQVQMHKKLTALRQLVQYMDPELYRHLQRSDSLNMFFAFRWLLISFKREFVFDEVMALWEALWSEWLTPQFDLFVALSVLDLKREEIIGKLESFDELLKYVNDLSGHLSLTRVLKNAEILYYQFENKVLLVESQVANEGSLNHSRTNAGSDKSATINTPSSSACSSFPSSSAWRQRPRPSALKNLELEEELTRILKKVFEV